MNLICKDRVVHREYPQMNTVCSYFSLTSFFMIIVDAAEVKVKISIVKNKNTKLFWVNQGFSGDSKSWFNSLIKKKYHVILIFWANKHFSLELLSRNTNFKLIHSSWLY